MHIVCLQSCAADSHAIKGLLTKCSANTNIELNRIEGRYVLAYHEGMLIGLADLAGEVPTCVLKEYKNANILHALQTEVKNAHSKHARKYRVASVL